MPGVLSKHAELIAEEEAGFEGDVAKKTQEDRARTMKMFKVYVFYEVNSRVAHLVRKEGKSGDRNRLSRISVTFLKHSPSISGLCVWTYWYKTLTEIMVK